MRIATAFALALLTIAAPGVLANAQAETRDPTFSKCTNLGNALDAPAEGEWGYTIEEWHFDELQKAGFDMIRLPVRWSAHTSITAPYAITPETLARVDEIVDFATARDMTIIIDVHHFNELYANPKAEREKFLAIWRQLAAHYADRPQNVYFELLNEPRDKLKGKFLDKLMADALKIVRETNPTRKVLLGGAPWNSLEALEQMAWPDDPNLIGTFHYYSPHPFTHQGAQWEDPVQPVGVSWGTDEEIDELTALIPRLQKLRAKLGVPIVLGEFGALEPTIPLEQRLAYYTGVRLVAEQADVSWCTWNFSSDFKIYDVEKKEWLPGMSEALGLDVTRMNPE
jgi:endoglucanase